MHRQLLLNKKKILIYSTSILVLAISTYYVYMHAYLMLPLDKRLQRFCALDDAHLAQEPRLWVDGHWTSPRSGSNLTVIVIWEAIDAGMWVYYSDTEDIFWVGVQRGPMKGAFYGPYEGVLWKLTNDMTPLAGIITSAIGITLSAIALLYSLVREASPKKN